MASSAVGLVEAITGLTADGQPFTVQNYLIDHVVTGGSATTDGSTGVFINVNGSVMQVPYIETPTAPAAGQLVKVLTVNGSPTMLGRVLGLPNV